MHRSISEQTRNEQNMMDKATRQLAITQDPVEKIRLICLRRGIGGIMAFGRQFRIFDDNRSGDITFQEFRNGLEDLGYSTTDEEYRELFQQFDKDNSGSIHYEEFIRTIRPPMNQMRIDLIEKAFEKLDKTGDGVVTLEDIQGVYNIKSNSEYLNGNKTEEQLLEDFLKKFEPNGSADAKVTRDEFIDYYSGVSASIDDDMYFDLMMRRCWNF